MQYFEERGYPPNMAGDILNNIKPGGEPYLYQGVSQNTLRTVSNSVKLSAGFSTSPRRRKTRSALWSSTVISRAQLVLRLSTRSTPKSSSLQVSWNAGNFSAAAGFGFEADKFGVFSTFSAFLEMVVSEITMARLNNCNVLCHFSHSGVDEVS